MATTASLSAAEPLSIRDALRSPKTALTEILSGIVTSLALIPEAMAFAIVTGLDPRTGLFGAVIIALVTSIFGGRPAMVSAAAGSVALVAAPLIAGHGIHYYFAAVILSGAFQILLAVLGAAKLMRFIPRSVMKGFINALAILIFSSQIPELMGVPWMVYPLVALGLAIVFIVPRWFKALPAPLIAIAVVTGVSLVAGGHAPTVGDKGSLPDALPVFGLPSVPWSMDLLVAVAPVAFAMAVVGMIESLLTAKLVDDLTDTHSNKTRESWALGLANVVSGLFGGSAGCAMIGQTMINVGTGARSRLSSLVAAASVLALIMSLHGVLAVIPMAALVAVMVYVAFTTFDWHSISPRLLRKLPWSETLVMVFTVLVTVLTHNLALGVGVGVIAALLAFVRRVSHLVRVERVLEEAADGAEGQVRYLVHGTLFFASSNDLYFSFRYAQDPRHVILDFSQAQIWDASTVATLDSITHRYESSGHDVEVTGLDRRSARFHDRLSGELDG
ncbi:SulP family inorganic anion transporter [Curtobacterium sp. S6]|uniref:SulP family inorganic anion transporter n=1 Tax=Curtobacterium sp. S6 TaxID=1479623 RepID=UPI0004AB1CC6|nr:SulP family inorganic anion transporter [Curtobacterium sp. S6]